jgi:hypothetical protein
MADQKKSSITTGTTTIMSSLDQHPNNEDVDEKAAEAQASSSGSRLLLDANVVSRRKSSSQHNDNDDKDGGGGSSTVHRDHDHTVRNSIVAGSMAGVVSTLLFHPMDVIRTKMQSKAMPTAGAAAAQPQQLGLGTSMSTSNISRPNKPPPSPVQTFLKTVQHGGYKSLYTGMALPLVAQTLYKATIFSINDMSRRALLTYRQEERQQKQTLGHFGGAGGNSANVNVVNHNNNLNINNNNNLNNNNANNNNKLGLVDTFLCGAIGGVVTACLWVTPVEYVRNQLIAQHSRLAREAKLNISTGGSIAPSTRTRTHHKYYYLKGPLDVVQHTLHTHPHGLRGLWTGVGVTMARDSLGCGLFFVAFEVGKTYIPQLLQACNIDDKYHAYTPMLTMVGAGSMAGIGFWVAALPLDTLKTLVQTGESSSARSTVRSLYYGHHGHGQQEGHHGGKGGHASAGHGSIRGLRSLFHGWQVAFARGAPSAVAILATYEVCHDMLHTHFP